MILELHFQAKDGMFWLIVWTIGIFIRAHPSRGSIKSKSLQRSAHCPRLKRPQPPDTTSQVPKPIWAAYITGIDLPCPITRILLPELTTPDICRTQPTRGLGGFTQFLKVFFASPKRESSNLNHAFVKFSIKAPYSRVAWLRSIYFRYDKAWDDPYRTDFAVAHSRRH